jgi:hypothetical protein
MRELGHVEGSDFDMLYRFSDGYGDRLPSLAEEVVRLKPDVILAAAIDTAVAVRKLTSTIPIVSGALADHARDGTIFVLVAGVKAMLLVPADECAHDGKLAKNSNGLARDHKTLAGLHR